MFGFTPNDAVGRPVFSFIAEEARDETIAAIVSSSPGVYTSTGIRDDGGRFPIQVGSMPIRWRLGEARIFTVRDLSPVALVVDDEAPVARMTAMLLRHAGYQTVTCTSARDALADYEPGTPAIVVSDVMMPELDGVSFVQGIRKLDPGVPVVFVTGYANVDVPLDEATVLIKKPFGIGDLDRALASLPERARAKRE